MRIVFILILTVIWCLIFFTVFIQLRKDTRCISETNFSYKIQNINGISIKEVTYQLIERYDVELQGSDIDPGVMQTSWMTCRHVHNDYEPRLGEVLHWLATVPVVGISSGGDSHTMLDKHTGHGDKLYFKLRGGYKALFKVKRFSRKSIPSNLSRSVLGPENHRGEIASYHLQRILGFNKGPIVVGRRLNFATEILPVADNLTKRKIFFKHGETCIRLKGTITKAGEKVLKTSELCTEKGMLEGVMILWLPRDLRAVTYVNPSVYWYGELVLKQENLAYPVVNEMGKLLDFIDSLILDYLTNNMDRHIFYFEPAQYSSLMFLDNGKSFSDPFYDNERLRKVFSHRCQLRNSTYMRLNQLKDGVLSTVLRHILSRDPIAPILWNEHHKALDRRLIKMLETIETCITHHGTDYALAKEVWPKSAFDIIQDVLKFNHLIPVGPTQRTILTTKYAIPKSEFYIKIGDMRSGGQNKI